MQIRRAQESEAEFLAEFGVIFLGITLSLMADDWRQSRVDREAERQSLQEVLADLTADSANLDDLRRHVARHDRDAAWLYSRLGAAGVNADSAVARIGSLHDAPQYQARSAAYVGIRSTGQLGLIRLRARRPSSGDPSVAPLHGGRWVQELPVDGPARPVALPISGPP